MQFSVQKYLNRGTATPCVARTAIQTQQLVSGFPLNESQKKELTNTSGEVMNHLVACLDAAESIVESIRQLADEFRESGGHKVGAKAIQIPGVPGLRKSVESFLYHAKLALRDTGALMNPFHGQSFGHRYDRLKTWAKDSLGTQTELVELLEREEGWVDEVIRMRNTVEHPNPPEEVLTVTDFTLTGPPDGISALEEPSIQLGSEAARPVVEFLITTQDHLLNFYEALLCTLLLPLGQGMGIEIHEIPEAERDPKNPVRFRPTIKLVGES